MVSYYFVVPVYKAMTISIIIKLLRRRGEILLHEHHFPTLCYIITMKRSISRCLHTLHKQLV